MDYGGLTTRLQMERCEDTTPTSSFPVLQLYKPRLLLGLDLSQRIEVAVGYKTKYNEEVNPRGNYLWLT